MPNAMKSFIAGVLAIIAINAQAYDKSYIDELKMKDSEFREVWVEFHSWNYNYGDRYRLGRSDRLANVEVPGADCFNLLASKNYSVFQHSDIKLFNELVVGEYADQSKIYLWIKDDKLVRCRDYSKYIEISVFNANQLAGYVNWYKNALQKAINNDISKRTNVLKSL